MESAMITRPGRCHLLTSLFVCLVIVVTSTPARADCSLTTMGLVPLSDLVGTYQGFDGGLYPGGAAVRPIAHEATGLTISQEQITPLDASGLPDAVGGKVVLLSLGMSNTVAEFSRFLQLVNNDPALHPRLTVVNGALSGMSADRYRDPGSLAWQHAISQVTSTGATREQVQVAWVKVALPGFGENREDPLANFPTFPQTLQADLETITRHLKTIFPNIKVAYFSSRIRAYVTPRGLSPEPTAYETGFAVRWAIARQIAGDPSLGLTQAPWMSWGPYLWADGLTPRSDGLTYECQDLQADFTHPADGALQKVAHQLKAFFTTDPTSTPWFLKPASGPPTVQTLSATPAGGQPGVDIGFSASASDADGIREYIWTFGDGTYAYGNQPRKVFSVPGRYTVRLTVIDQGGNAAFETLVVDVGSDPPELPPDTPANLRLVGAAAN